MAGIAAAVRARIIVAAGDVRALGYLSTRCPSRRGTSCKRSTPAAGAAGASEASLAEHVRRLVSETAVRAKLATVEEFGQHDRAVEGLANTVAALRRAQVQTVVLGDGLDDDATLHIGTEAGQLAEDPQELADGVGAVLRYADAATPS